MFNTQEILHRAISGEQISEEECNFIYRDANLGQLASAADSIRKRINSPDTVTYLIDRNINYTNVCDTACKFCAFYRPYGHKESYVLSRDILAQKIEETLEIGGTRILMQGGHHPDLRLDWYQDLLGWIRKTYPKIQTDCFSPSEIDNICQIENKSAYDVLSALKDAGLMGLPGGGAELLDDRIRSRVSPKKISGGRWIEIMDAAQSLKLATSASMVIGFGETDENRVRHLSMIREQQNKAKERGDFGFIAFISWTLQHEQTALGRQSINRGLLGSGANEYLRNLAISRIYLQNIEHMQSSWPTQGYKVAQVALEFGADDFGSTMMEENVVSQASTKTQQKVQVDEILSLVHEAGFIPRQRNTWYQIVA